jgi:hypothetical protein
MLSQYYRPVLFVLLAMSGTAIAQDSNTAPASPSIDATTTAAPAPVAPSADAPAAATPAAAAPAPAAPAPAAPSTDATAAPAGEATGAEAPAAEAPAASAAASADGKIGAPPAGKGQIVFFRPSKFAGAAIGFKVREGETELGKLRSGNYFVAVVEPGTHQYIVHSEAKDILTMEVEAGETYYVQGTITMGFMAGRPNLSPSDQAAFDGMAAKLKRVQ